MNAPSQSPADDPNPFTALVMHQRRRQSRLVATESTFFEARPPDRPATPHWTRWLPALLLSVVMLALTAGSVIAAVQHHHATIDPIEASKAEASRRLAAPPSTSDEPHRSG